MSIEETIQDIDSAMGIAIRAKIKEDDVPSNWSRWFIIPVPGYVEASSFGPMPRREIQWLEIDPIEIKHIGRLVPPKSIDHTTDILQILDRASIVSEIIEGRIRIAF
ncbi:MAG: hypothetical protein EOO55_04995 [Hymenobacter sp.]|nr:MAG: hypothetical protein EOO55_04995 [Hymenobacter sp.]